MKVVRKSLFILLALLMLGTIGYYYINKILLPVKFKQFAEDRIESYLGRTTSINKLEYDVLKGFVIKDIEIHEKHDDTKLFANIKEASFTILFAPIFKNKKIIIPRINVKDATVFIERKPEKLWNFSDLLRKRSKKHSQYTILPSKLTVTDSQINYLDTTKEDSLQESFEDLNFEIHFTLERKIAFLIECILNKTKLALKIKGDFEPISKALSFKTKLEDCNVKSILPFFDVSADPLLENAIISSAILDAQYSNKTFHVTGSLLSHDLKFHLKNKNTFTADIWTENLSLKWKDRRIMLNGSYELSKAQLKFGRNSQVTSNIKADIANMMLSNNTLKIEASLTGKNTELILGENNVFKGNVSINDGLYFSEGNIIRTEGHILSEKTDISFLDNNSLKGSIDAKDFKLLKSPKGLKITTNLSIIDTDLQSGEDVFLTNKLLSFNNFSLVSEEHFISTQASIKSNDSEIILRNNRKLKGSISSDLSKLVYSKDQTQFISDLHIESADLTINENIRLQASPSININIKHTPKLGSDIEKELTYTAEANFSNALFTGIPKLGTIRNIFGKTFFKNDSIKTDSLTFNTQDTDLEVSGNLENFKKPKVNLQISTNKIDLKTVTNFIPILQEKYGITLAGKTAAKLQYKGKLKDISPKDISADLDISTASIGLKFLTNPIKRVKGKITYNDDLLVWKNLKGFYNNDLYSFNGNLENLSRPTLITDFTGNNISLSTEIRPLNEAFRIVALTGTYFKSTYDITGDVHFFDDEAPDIDLRGAFNLDAREIAAALPYLPFVKNNPKRIAFINRMSPSGTFELTSLFKGKYKDWRNWQLVLKANSEFLRLYETPLEKVSFSYEQRDRHISKLNAACNIYNGTFNFISSGDLTRQSIPVDITASIDALDLSLLRKNQRVKSSTLSGKGSIDVKLSGPIKKPELLTGLGSLAISEGYIWHWNILQGLTNAILIPEFQKVYFTDASANFTVSDKKIYTDNALMVGNTVDLTGHGWIDFSKNLNFTITPNFNESVIMQSDSLKKAPTSLLTQAITIYMGGTLKKPTYNVETSPLRIIESTTEILTEGIKGVGSIIGDLF